MEVHMAKRTDRLRTGLNKVTDLNKEAQALLVKAEDVLSKLEDQDERRIARQRSDERSIRQRYSNLGQGR
jgi:F0F1-type ATP synthase membrane subunit b/b'